MKTGKKEKSALGRAVGADNHGPWSDGAKNRAYSQCLPTLAVFLEAGSHDGQSYRTLKHQLAKSQPQGKVAFTSPQASVFFPSKDETEKVTSLEMLTYFWNTFQCFTKPGSGIHPD